jgi:ribose 5-phosphate isomerase B
MTLGSEIVGVGVAKKLVDIWLATEFQGGRSAPKVAKIKLMDEQLLHATKPSGTPP